MRLSHNTGAADASFNDHVLSAKLGHIILKRARERKREALRKHVNGLPRAQ